MAKPGENPDPRHTPDSRALTPELQQLRKAGLSDLALRPKRYPHLMGIFDQRSGTQPGDIVTRLTRNAVLFDALVQHLPSPQLRDAAKILFHTGHGTPPRLDDRRRAADRIYTQRGHAREPDTIQRQLERDLLDPILIDLLLQPTVGPSGPNSGGVDHDSWSDDLERVFTCLSHQDFAFAAALLDRWLSRTDPSMLDTHGMFLRGRSLILYGNMQRDQGRILGPLSARKSYEAALAVFAGLGNPRRQAQAEQMIAVTDEMSSNLDAAAAEYLARTADDRLSDLERARAQLWLGTTLTKQHHLGPAVTAITQAARLFEQLDEPDDWSVAHQKLALGHLAAGDTGGALRYMEIALSHRRTDSPLQQVRLDTAHAHLLLTDPQTRSHGMAVLDEAHRVADRYGLSHQLRSIRQIRREAETDS